MTRTIGAAYVAAVAVLVAVSGGPAAAQTGGRVIEAAEGDVVVVPAEARVDVVRRQTVAARLVFYPDNATLVMIAEQAGPDGVAPQKRFSRWSLGGAWPFQSRWEGTLTIDDYHPGFNGGGGTALRLPWGAVLLASPTRREPETSGLPTIPYGASSMRTVGGTFDEIEQAWLAGGDEALNRRSRGSASVALRHETESGGRAPLPPLHGTAGAVRVGGAVRAPTKLNQVAPVYPAVAKAAGVQGVVILELAVGVDGSVTDARVLRSIPLLDAAALECVRQWRYEPTLLNGTPVPIILTATVNFTLSPP